MQVILYVLGARGAHVHTRIADLSMQTWVDSQSYTKYTPSRTSSLFVLVIQCIKYLTMMVTRSGSLPY